MVAKGNTSQEQSYNVNDEQKSSKSVIFNIGKNIDGKWVGKDSNMGEEIDGKLSGPTPIIGENIDGKWVGKNPSIGESIDGKLYY